MSVWQVTREQWRAWARDVAACSPAGPLDALDEQVRELLGRGWLGPGPATETTLVGIGGDGVEGVSEGMPGLARGEITLDDDAESAQTLVRQAPDWDGAKTEPRGFQVGLSAGEGGFDIELEPAAAPARETTVVAPTSPEPVPELSRTSTGTVVAPAPEPVGSGIDGDGADDGGLYIPALTRRADTGPILLSEAAALDAEIGAPQQEAEEIHSAEIETAEPVPPPTPGAAPPPVPRAPKSTQIQSETRASASGSFTVEPEFFDDESHSGEIAVDAPDPPRVTVVTGTQELPVQGTNAFVDERPPPVQPKIVIARPALPVEDDAQELDEQDLVEAETPASAPPPTRPPAAPPEPPAARVEPPAPPRESAPVLAALQAQLDPALLEVPPMTDWCAEAFGEHYAALDRPDTLRVVDREIEAFLAATGMSPGRRILDVGCGAGSHAIALARRGFEVIGIDASPHQLRRAVRAAEVQSAAVQFVNTDMRNPEVDGPFDAVLCLGTTLGYFDDRTNLHCLQVMRDLLVPGGKLWLEVFNRDHVIGRLPSRSWWQGQGCLVLDEAEMNYATNRLHVHRTVVFEDGRQYDHQMYMRAFTLYELAQMCALVGLTIREVSGSRQTRGRFFGATSPEIWLLAERPPDRA